MKKILLTIMLGIFLITLVGAAQETLGTFQQDACIDLTQTCVTCTYNNLTSIIYPNGTKNEFSPEQSMTRSGTEYIFNTCNFSAQLGTYIVNGYGDLDGTDTLWNYNYHITPTGETLDNAQSIVVLGLIFFLLFLTCAFLIFGMKTESVPFKIFLISLGSLFLMFTLGFTLNAIKQLMLIGSVFSGMFVSLYTLILILVSAGGIGLMLYLITMSVKAFRRTRGDGEDD